MVECRTATARINRIFEGTNEINRMLIPGVILKRTMKGQLQLFALIQEVEKVVGQDRAEAPAYDFDSIDYDAFLVEKAKQLSVFMANLAIQKHMSDIKDQQEILVALADLISAVYAMDSTVARVKQRLEDGDAKPVHKAICHTVVADEYAQVVDIAYRLAPVLAEGDKLQRRFDAIDKFVYRPVANPVELQRTIAGYVLENPRWAL